MTKNEYNRDVKRLRNAITEAGETPALRKEFMRLYNADDNFEYANKQSILTMFRLNQRYRFVPLHTFGINIEI